METDKGTKELIEQLAKGNGEILAGQKAIRELVDKANTEAASAGRMSEETKKALDDHIAKTSGLIDRMLEVEREVKGGGLRAKLEVAKSLGHQFGESEAFKALVGGSQSRARFEVKGGLGPLMTKVDPILNAAAAVGAPLVPEFRVPGIISPEQRRFTIRDLLPVGQTNSNLIYFAKENVFTDNAGPQYSSPATEGETKPQSSLTFTSDTTPVVTLAHFFLVSKQVLEDAPMLASYINTRGLYALKLEEEDELLNGDGTAGKLKGLLHSDNCTAYDRGASGDTIIDTIRKMITQCALSEFSADAIVLNPEDWETIELLKDEQGRYIFANPQGVAGPVLWGRRVVVTQSIAAGTALVGAFGLAAQIWDREQAAIELSREDGENFRKNLVTLLFEERLALSVYRKSALIKASV